MTTLLLGCAEVYYGPIADKPIQTTTDEQGRVQILTLYNRLLQEDIPELPLQQAMDYFDANKAIIYNQHWLSILDFNEHSGQPRLYVMNLYSGDVDKLFVAHGKGSDMEHTGYARTFSNTPNSLMSSLGFYLVNEPYQGKWGLSARLDGLQESNSNARERAIVMHGADYVESGREKMGRSEGCPAVELKWIETLVHRLAGRSLLYAYVDGL